MSLSIVRANHAVPIASGRRTQSLRAMMELPDRKRRIMDADLLLFRGKGAISRAIQCVGRSDASHASKASWWDDDLMCLELREFRGGRAVTLWSQVQKHPGQIDVYRANAIGLPEWTQSEWKALLKRVRLITDPARRMRRIASLIAENGNRRYCRQGSNWLMRQMAGRQYGYAAILKTAIVHCPLLALTQYAARWIPVLRRVSGLIDPLKTDTASLTNDRLASGAAPYCSAAGAIADRIGGGVDPVPSLADAFTEPGDLARSQFYAGVNNDGYLFTLVP